MSDSDKMYYVGVAIVVAIVLIALWRYRREGFIEGLETSPSVGPQASPVEPVAETQKAVIQPVGIINTRSAFVDVPDNAFLLDDGSGNGQFSIQNNLFSPDCCSAQWPTGIKTEKDPFICQAMKNGDFVPSRYFGNNGLTNAGCLCMTKNQARFLALRGGENREFW